MALYEDIFDDSIKVNVKNDYFYVMVDKTAERNPVPTYVFPDFKKLYNMMTLMDLISHNNWDFGRIPTKGDFFSARLPYLKRFLNRQEESINEYNNDFKNSKKPSDQLSEKQLKEFEVKVFGHLE